MPGLARSKYLIGCLQSRQGTGVGPRKGEFKIVGCFFLLTVVLYFFYIDLNKYTKSPLPLLSSPLPLSPPPLLLFSQSGGFDPSFESAACWEADEGWEPFSQKMGACPQLGMQFWISQTLPSL